MNIDMLCTFLRYSILSWLHFQVLLNAIETTVSYTVAKYNTYLPVAISESSVINSTTFINNFNYQSRTFQLMKSTFALIKHPDKIIGRLTFDYKVDVCCVLSSIFQF